MKKSTQERVRRTCGRDTGVSGFTHGTGYLDGNGFVHYNPDANYFGAAQFNYTVQASTGQTGAANDIEWFGERRVA